MESALKDSVTRAVDSYIKENSTLMTTWWNEILNTGIRKYVTEALDYNTTKNLRYIFNNLIQKQNEERQKQGLQPLVYPIF